MNDRVEVLLTKEQELICTKLAQRFNDGSGWDDGHTWPQFVYVDDQLYIKYIFPGHFGDIDNSYYVPCPKSDKAPVVISKTELLTDSEENI